MELIQGLKVAVDSLKAAVCRMVYVNSSLVTSRDLRRCRCLLEPGRLDIDLLYAIEPILFNFENRRAAQTETFNDEFLLHLVDELLSL